MATVPKTYIDSQIENARENILLASSALDRAKVCANNNALPDHVFDSINRAEMDLDEIKDYLDGIVIHD